MKIPESWLRSWVNSKKSLAEICGQLTMAGLEVEDISPYKIKLQNVVVGEVLNVAEHPDASRLHVCLVNVGQAETLQIVCGAKNVRANLKVPVALVGAILPNGVEIKKAKLRGVDSHGMICSAVELSLAEVSEGILELPQDAPVGADINEYLSLDDNIIEINITPNRSDCLSISGIAREVAALEGCELITPAWHLVPSVSSDEKKITIDVVRLCPHYIGRIIKNINNKTPTPIWMRERLRRCGIRPLSLIVDIANYVMLELGQPLHAFDLRKAAGDMAVRFAKEGEDIILLDNSQLKLTAEDLVIADQEKILALAGIMGGKAAEVSEDTTDIFLESALFSSPIISASVRRFGLHTEASHRFERGVDPNIQYQACQRFTSLLQEFTCNLSVAADCFESVSDEFMPKRQPIYLRADKIKTILGLDLKAEIIDSILKRLGMKVTEADQGWMVTPPSYRLDINVAVDLLEEVARIHGYDKLEEKNLDLPLLEPNTEPALTKRRRLAVLLADLGYREVITYSFVDPKLQAMLVPGEDALALNNPISSDMSVMRSTLWPGLIKTALYNKNRQQERMRFFESGLCFIQKKEILLQQNQHLAGILTGDIYREQWAAPNRKIDFFDIKSDVEKIFQLFGFSSIHFKPEYHPALHPGVCARIYLPSLCPVGFMGKLHPNLQNVFGCHKDVYLFEINLSFLAGKFDLKFKKISKFPFIQRDIAIILNEEITWSEIREKISDAAGEILKNIELFDLYRSEGIGKGKKSIALRLTLQDVNRTLTESEADVLQNKIVKILEMDFKGKLRG